MGRRVDETVARDALAEAVWRLAARGGLEAVSIRAVAATAGVSVGRVQHWFPTKDDLLLHGLALAQRRLGAQVQARVDAVPTEDEPEMLRVLLHGLLGDDAETRALVRVCVAYYPRVVDDPRVAALLTAEDDELLVLATGVIARARSADAASGLIDPRAAATVLWTLATSLAVEVALGRTDTVSARTLIDYQLDQTLATTGRP